MYAIIKTGGKQYKVSEGDKLKVEKLDAESGKKVTFEEVLLIGGEKPKVGTPKVSGAKVVGEVVRHGKRKKVIVFHRRKRKGFHKKQGHRQEFTEVKIEKISV